MKFHFHFSVAALVGALMGIHLEKRTLLQDAELAGSALVQSELPAITKLADDRVREISEAHGISPEVITNILEPVADQMIGTAADKLSDMVSSHVQSLLGNATVDTSVSANTGTKPPTSEEFAKAFNSNTNGQNPTLQLACEQNSDTSDPEKAWIVRNTVTRDVAYGSYAEEAAGQFFFLYPNT